MDQMVLHSQALLDSRAARYATSAFAFWAILTRFGVIRSLFDSFTISVEVTSKDDAYTWVKGWLDQQVSASNTQHLSAEVHVDSESAFADDSRALRFVPAVGKHWFFFKGRPIRVVRDRNASLQDLNTGVAFESITLTTAGRDASFLRRMLTELRSAAFRNDHGKTRIFAADGGGRWERLGLLRAVRPWSSVVLPPGVADALYGDMLHFRSNPKWYRDRGIPWRRGYLLSGPPGGGKTSLVRALAGRIGADICVVGLSDPELTDSALASLLNTARGGAILLIEDVDTVAAAADLTSPLDSNTRGADSAVDVDSGYCPGVEVRTTLLRQRAAAASESALTLGGLLNALDGVAAQEGRIVILTTNHVDHLAPALLRPGRVDIALRVGRATRGQVVAFVKHFYRLDSEIEDPEGSLSLETCEKALAALDHWASQQPESVPPTLEVAGVVRSGPLAGELPFSMATLQGHCIAARDDVLSAIRGLDNLRDRSVIY